MTRGCGEVVVGVGGGCGEVGMGVGRCVWVWPCGYAVMGEHVTLKLYCMNSLSGHS